MPKVDKNNWAKTMKNIVLYLKLVRGMREIPLAYKVWCHIKVAQIPPGSATYLNLDKEMITRASIIDARLNLRMTQDMLDREYLSYQCNTFKIDNALMYHIFSKMFTDMDAYIYMKQRRGMQDG